MATLIGYGAAAINPYLMFESLDELADRSLLPEDLDREEAEKRIVKAIGKGLLKTISKMGISTIQSYCGAQIFEAVGLDRELIDKHFTGTASRIGGIGLDVARRPRRSSATSAPTRAPTATCCPSAACCSGAATASSTSGTRTRSPSSSTRFAARPATAGRPTRSSRGSPTTRRRAALDAARADEAAHAARADPARPGRAGDRDRQALHHRRDEPRRAQPRGARDAGDRDEPDRRQVQHRRGRRGPGALRARRQRRRAPLGDQAGRLGPLRRDDRTTWSTPTSCRSRWRRAPSRARAASCPATRSTTTSPRSATRPPGVGPDLAAAAPRHLLDRGPQAADLRPALRQPDRLRCRSSSCQRGRRRHGRRRRRQGQRRPRHDLRPRRRHRRLAAVLDPRRRRPLGDRAGRDPADADAQRPALAGSRSRSTAR